MKVDMPLNISYQSEERRWLAVPQNVHKHFQTFVHFSQCFMLESDAQYYQNEEQHLAQHRG